MKNNIIFEDNILWYDINEKGHIKGFLNFEPAVYVYKVMDENKSCYVGASARLKNRINSHRSRVANWNKDYYNNNGSLLFYNSVLKKGWDNFQFGVLEYIDLSGNENRKERREIILKREQYYLDNINPSLNKCKIAGSPLGIKHNNSFSINLSKARRGKVYKVNNINSNISKYTSPETRLKLSSRSKGISVKIYDKRNNLINKFPSMLSAANYVGVSDRTLRRVLNTGISYDNFIYEFDIETNNPIIVLNKEDNTTRNFYSIRTAAKDMAVSCTNLSEHINTNKLLRGIYKISK